MDKIEKNSFIAMPGKGSQAGACPQSYVSTWGWGGKFGEEFYSKGSRVALLIRIRVCANLASGGLLTKFCGSQVINL